MNDTTTSVGDCPVCGKAVPLNGAGGACYDDAPYHLACYIARNFPNGIEDHR